MTSSIERGGVSQASDSHFVNENLEAILGESLVDWVPGLGASLAVTPTRVVVIRHGAERRPRTGLRAWAHGDLDARLDPPRGGNGRIVLGTGANPYAAVSVFVAVAHWSIAVRSVATIRAEARRARRHAAGRRRPAGLRRRARSERSSTATRAQGRFESRQAPS